MAKSEFIDEVETEYKGKIYLGKRKVIGINPLDQIVAFNGLCIVDNHGYEKSQRDTVMKSIASQLLFELVSGRTLSAQNSGKYGL